MTKLNINDNLSGFVVTDCTFIDELNCNAYTLKHSAGSVLYFLDSDDTNKVFGVSFTTPAENDTGVFHIIEHSVLCGSDNYNLKEPFVNLLKSSMQTYLNAATYPDKTIYPVATTCEKDLTNLMSVYLDAVFRPAILSNKSIFLQEGWHYDLAEKFDISGVVYNEMKGNLDGDDASSDALFKALFPNTAYGKDSGGLPSAIPTLSYENFLATYKKYYTAKNATFFLYGNVSLAEKIELISSYIVSDKGERFVSSKQEPIMKITTVDYDCGSAENLEKYYLTVGFCPVENDEYEKLMAINIIDNILLANNQSVLKKAVLDSGLASDMTSEWHSNICQPVYFIRYKDILPENQEKLFNITLECVANIIDNGFNKAELRSCIKMLEFISLEQNTNYVSPGIYHFLKISAQETYGLPVWNKFRTKQIIKSLYDKVDSGWFESILNRMFYGTKHKSIILARPVVGYTNIVERKAMEVNESNFNKLSECEIKQIHADNEVFNNWQASTDSEDDIASIPSLELADLPPVTPDPEKESFSISGIKSTLCKHHSDITYTTCYFGIDGLSDTEISAISLLSSIIDELDTQAHTAKELETITQERLGSWSVFCNSYDKIFDSEGNRTTDGDFNSYVFANFSSMQENINDGFSITRERLLSFTPDENIIAKSIKQKLISIKESYSSSGHACAINELRSMYTPSGVVNSFISGREFTKNLEEFEKDIPALIALMQDVARKIFVKDNCFIIMSNTKVPTGLSFDLPNGEVLEKLSRKTNDITHTGLEIAGNLNYVCMGYKLNNIDERTLAHLPIITQILDLEYLWNEVRAKGGAYGAGCSIAQTGLIYFYSYRDGQTTNTINAYKTCADYLENLEMCDDELIGHIISVLSNADKPSSARLRASINNSNIITGVSAKSRTAVRNHILSLTTDDVRAFSKLFREIAENATNCIAYSSGNDVSALIDKTIILK